MIGSIVRSSGRLLKSDSGSRASCMLDKVQGMGVPVEELGISQVLRISWTWLFALHLAFRTCESLAGDHGVSLCGSEVVGFVPLSAMLEARYFMPDAERDEDLVNAPCHR